MAASVPLSVLSLKEIAKLPSKCIDESKLARAFKILPADRHDDIVQQLVDYITEAGRMDHTALPPTIFSKTRTQLSLKNSKLTAAFIMAAVERCGRSLLDLDISGCFHVDDNLVLYVLQHCPKLVQFSIRNCRKLTDSVLTSLVQHGTHITSLHLGGLFNLSSDGITAFLQNKKVMGRFCELHLSGLSLTDAHMALLAQNCAKVTTLSVAYAEVSEASLRGMLQALGQQLVVLNVGWVLTFNAELPVASDFLDFIGKTCPFLAELDISGLKSLQLPVIEHFLGLKRRHRERHPTDERWLRLLKAKFLSPRGFQEAAGIQVII